MPERTALEELLAEWESYCSAWSDAYHRAAQHTLTWNNRAVVTALIASAATTVITTSTASITSTATTGRLAIGVAVVGAIVSAVTTVANAIQKATFASPEQVKQYHTSAASYAQVGRHIKLIRAYSDAGAAVEEIRKEFDAVRTQLDTIDAQALELPARFMSESTQSRKIV